MSLERLVQFIGIVLLHFSLFLSVSLSRSCFLSILPTHFHPLFRRAAVVSEKRWGRDTQEGSFCPSFVSSSNYDLPHEYEPYVNIRASPLRYLPFPYSTYSIVWPSLSPALCLSLFRLSFSFFPISPFLSFPVTAARTSFRAPWGCKCIRDDGRVLPE